MAERSERQIAQQTQEKFQFYFLSLVFTLLALTVQTSKFGRSTVEDVLELGGWLGLLFCGLMALSRLEWDSAIRMQMVRRDEAERARDELQRQAAAGVQVVHVIEDGQHQQIQDRIQMYNDALKQLGPHIEKMDKWDTFKYDAAKYSFVVGLGLVVVSRSIGAIADLFGYRLI